MQKLKRRLQQLFIASAVVGTATVVACSSEDDVKVFAIENRLDYPIRIAVESDRFFDGEEEFLQSTNASSFTYQPGISRFDFVIDDEGREDTWFIRRVGKVAVRLQDDSGNDWRFWVTMRAIGRTGCKVVISDALISYLNMNRDKTRELVKDQLILDDFSLLNPDGGIARPFNDCVESKGIGPLFTQ